MLCVQLRDKDGIKADLADRLLKIKRADLGAVLTGEPRPPAFGALMFSDIERGVGLYDKPGVESGLVGQYLPVPISGMFGTGTDMSDICCLTAKG